VPVNRAGSLTGRRVLAAVGVVLACALIWTASAGAETFFVDTVADEADATPGSDGCLTAGEDCSLRAALEEANFSSEEFDEILFEEGVFEGDDDSVIELTAGLPPITTPLRLASRECQTGAGVVGPCVEINGDPGEAALTVEETDEPDDDADVELEWLALTDAGVGIDVKETPQLLVRSNWLGVALDGSTDGNTVGIHLGPGSDRSRIGGEGADAGNLIAGSSTAGLEIVGASNVRILGNDFGVTPSGTQAANELNLTISSSADSVAMDNTVGTRLSPVAAATAACDGGCNLITSSNSSGINLTGSGGSGPPIGTTIAGNHIGLDATGEANLPNGAAGIRVGKAPRTTIGGPRLGDENRIAGGTAAVQAGPEAPNLVIRGNLIGSRANAAGTAEPPQEGLLVNSEGLSFPAEEAQVLDNEIGLGGGVGISQGGLGAEISGNLVEGAVTGIEVQESGSENLIDSNLVKATEIGVLVKGSFNAIVGNTIAGSQKTGIRIEGTGLFGVSGNVVGGDIAATENAIDGSTRAAIEIVNPLNSWNEVARNRGAGGGPFIALIAKTDPGDEPGDPNGGILPPPIAAISEVGAAGFAEPGALVRVFRKTTPAPGEIASFLGQATADDKGNWSLGFPTPLPVGTAIAATQTLNGGTSELELAAVPPLAQEAQSPAAGGPVDRRPPRTRVLRQPRRVPEGGIARFTFTSNEAGSRFQCSLNGGKYRACKSPKKYRDLRPGKHIFRVRAIDAAGNVDRTPVKRRFEVLG
jgi:CSLREA domain-containing protein